MIGVATSFHKEAYFSIGSLEKGRRSEAGEGFVDPS
jgi:hypothetical protein